MEVLHWYLSFVLLFKVSQNLPGEEFEDRIHDECLLPYLHVALYRW
jgi:hypothetical protein